MLNNKSSQKSQDLDALPFLEKLRPGGPWVLTAIDPDTEAITTITATTPDEAEAFIRKHDDKRNLYYSVNPTRRAMSKKAKKTDIAAIEFAFADLDPAKGETSAAAKARYLKQLKVFKPKPTAAVDSGNGIQCLWRLAEPIALASVAFMITNAMKAQLRERGYADEQIAALTPTEAHGILNVATEAVTDVEARVKAVMLKLGSKPGTQNIDRILRLPGTINLPYAAKKKAGRVACPTKLLWFNDASYPLDAFPISAGDNVAPKPSNVVDLNGDPLDPWTVVAREIGLGEVEELVEQGAPEGERSDKFHFTVCTLLEACWTRDEILTLLQQHPEGIAERYTTERRLPEMVDYSIDMWSKKHPSDNDNDPTVEFVIKPKKPAFEFVDLTLDLAERQWLVSDRIPMSNVTLFSGEGATGKSIAAKQLSAGVILRKQWIGLTPMQGKVLYLSCEEDDDELRRRFDKIAAHYDSTREELMAKGLHLLSRVEESSVMAEYDRDKNCMRMTSFFKDLQAAAVKIQPKLIVLDTSADVFGGSEIDRNQVSEFIKMLRRMARAAGGAAVLLISHPSLTGITSGSGLSGTTAWHNRVRARIFIKSVEDDEDSDEREIEFKKNQYGPKGETVQLYWNDGVFSDLAVKRPADAMPADELFMHLLERYDKEGRAVSDKTGTSYAPAKFCEEPEAKRSRVGNKELTKAMLRLFATGKIKVEIEGPPSKRRSRIVVRQGSK